MTTIPIEKVLLEYHKATGKNWTYSVQQVAKFPSVTSGVQSVCIHKTYLQYYEHMDPQTNSSIIYWMLEFVKEI